MKEEREKKGASLIDPLQPEGEGFIQLCVCVRALAPALNNGCLPLCQHLSDQKQQSAVRTQIHEYKILIAHLGSHSYSWN